MNQNKFKESNLWKKLNTELFNLPDQIDLKDFRSPNQKINFRLASWSPLDKTQRYYKNILFNLATSMPEKFFKYYEKIDNANLGSPLAVTVKGQKINLDYLFSIQEIIFLEEVLKSISSIMEIGGGLGEQRMQ